MKTRNRKFWLTLWLGCIGLGLAGIWYIWPAPTPAWPRETAVITKLTHKYGIEELSRQHWVVFVSVGGCGFCLGHLLTFIGQHPGDPAYVFIIPGKSRKDFALDIPPRIRSQKNVFRDSLELSFRDSLLQPTENTAYRIEEGKVTEKVVLTPENIAEKLRYIAGSGHD